MISMNWDKERRALKSDADNLLHRLWTKAVGGKEYDKREWLALERLIWKEAGQVPAQAEGEEG